MNRTGLGFPIGILASLLSILFAGSGFAVGASGIDEGWIQQVRDAIHLEEYAVTPAEEPLGADAPSYQAFNPAHRLTARFTGAGLTLAPDAPGQAPWEWRLSLMRWGSSTDLRSPEAGTVSSSSNRVEIARGPRAGIVEWYVNSPNGLEQGFTIPAPPAGDGTGLALDMNLEGSLRPQFAEDGRSIDFFDRGSLSVLRYSELSATDAAGRSLPARLEAIPGGIRIAVDDAEAVYPLTIDPLMTTPAWTASGDENSAQFSRSLATAGDVNGDGYSDVIAGAFFHDGGGVAGADRGRAYVYLGSASGVATSPSWTTSGDEDGANYGWSAATAGDVNGDGYADVVVGAYHHDGGGGANANRGRAYLYLGSAGGLATSPAWTTSGDDNNGSYGSSVATAGDVNDDGYSDVLVGAYTHDGGAGAGADRGRAYLYLGSAGGLATTPAWTASGDENGALVGSVATAGDVNADGFADVMVGAYAHDAAAGTGANRGRAYLYLGSAAGLASSPNWTGSGDENGAFYGSWVGTAGDVNGDGYADFVVNAALHDAGASPDRGRAYLYLGSSGTLSTVPSWTVSGDEDFALLGETVATAGDVNGDGYSDVLVGAHGHDAGAGAGADRGRAYLYLGSSGGLATTPEWVAAGDENVALFGRTVATAGDVNGDGFSDVVVGAYGHDAGGGANANRGRAYLYLGSASGLAAAEGWVGSGDETGASYGFSVASAGDVNGDGYADVIVGAALHDVGAGAGADRGRAYLYLGSAGGLTTTPVWSAWSVENGAQFGGAVATAGDVNGDGYSDVLVGAYFHDAGGGSGANRGRAYLYLGSPSGLAAGFSWVGSGDANNDYFGFTLATAGDVNGDGFSDVVVGIPGYSNGQTVEGGAKLYLGSASGLSTSSAWTGECDKPFCSYGRSVASAGDVNRDGYSDVIVGANGNAGPADDQGAAFVYLGSALGLSPTYAWTYVDLQQKTTYANSVASAGDVNGDGYSDVIVGAPGDRYPDNWGRAYVYLGSPSGPATATSWTVGGDHAFSNLGSTVAGAGDVNGDGFSDVVINGSNESYVYLGSASGLALTRSWIGTGPPGSAFGRSIAAAGDVNGDAFCDVLIGAPSYDSPATDAGKAFLFYGGGGNGLGPRPRQRAADDARPIARLGASGDPDRFRLAALGRSPFGRTQVRLEREVKPFGTPLNGTGAVTSSGWSDTGTIGATVSDIPTALLAGQPYHWRLRFHYEAASTPFQKTSRWFTMPAQGAQETMLRTAAAVVGAGSVPDGSNGAPLTAAKTGGSITLTWAASCNGETDYEVYQGTIGNFTSHTWITCSTSGATTWTFSIPTTNTYFLVVPRNASREGSYGKRSGGVEIPSSASACLPQQIVSCP